MRIIKVTFDNGDEITTSINGTNKEIEAYYLGNYVNLGNGPNDLMAKATKVEFLN